jgi:hypothetical protein
MFPLDKDTNKNRKPYEYKTEEDDGYSYMAAEPVPERDDWIDMKLSATKPHIDEVCLVYGYQLPGMNKYFTAIYKGRGQWQPVMDNKYPLDFTILKWKHINLVNDEDEE